MFKAAALKNRVSRSNFCQNQLFLCSSIYNEVACSLLDLEPGFSVFSFPFWIEILSGSWSRHRVIFSKLLSEPACSSQVDLHWTSPHLPWGMQRICWPFILEFIREILSTSMFFWCSIYIETAQNSREECNEFADLLFWRLSLRLSRDSLSCDTRSLDLCVLKFICLYLWYIPPHSWVFTHFTLHQFFLTYITTRNIFLIPGDAVAQNLIIVYNFSSQRPHLNYVSLSNVYSFDSIEFSMKHKY